MSKRTVNIREEDYELLRKMAAQEERDMTQVLHRALLAYSPSALERLLGEPPK